MARQTEGTDEQKVREPLLRLALDLSRLSPLTLWRALTPEERHAAVAAFLRRREMFSEYGDGRQSLVDIVASARNMRAKTVASWSDEKLAAAAGTTSLEGYGLLRVHVLGSFHLEERAELLAAFLDSLGFNHENGLLVEEQRRDVPATKEETHRAADILLEQHDINELITYFLVLILQHEIFTTDLAGWLSAYASTLERASLEEQEEPLPTREPGDAVPERVDEFTTLDRQLIRTIVDAAQSVEGAFSTDELDDLVQEVVELNSSRHRSYFHLGFSDSVLLRQPREQLPAENEDRIQWYWAGYLSGLARRREWIRIVELYDRHRVIRGLGVTGRGPSHAAVEVVARALWECDRPGDLAGFVSPEAIVRQDSRTLFPFLKEKGTELLRMDRASEARAIFERLERAVDMLENRGVDTRLPVFLEVRRRQAHCLRQLGEMRRAAELLEDVLTVERDDDVRAMVLSDLGLIEAGVRRLAEVRLPQSQENLSTIRENLERGEARFRASSELRTHRAAHGHYCLGVLAMLRTRYDDAVAHFDQALSTFESEPNRYRPGELLGHARLYLALSICLAPEPMRMPRAVEIIENSLEEGFEVPGYLLANLLTGLELRSAELAREVAEELLVCQGHDSLDAAIASPAARTSHSIASALLTRAQDGNRGFSQARDYRTVLPLLLEQERHEEAASVLDSLEELALRGVGDDEFLELLSDEANFDGAWSLEDARWSRVTCLESVGRFEEAASILTEMFHSWISQARYEAEAEARGLVERIEGYGLEEEWHLSLERRLERLQAEDAPAPPASEAADRKLVRILFVGGDEERQGPHVDAVLAAVEQRDPNVRVEFVLEGWDSNWGRTLDTIQARLPSFHGVVIMRYIRTEFGRRLRKSIEIPWVQCSGAGRGTMANSICLAADLARRYRRGGTND